MVTIGTIAEDGLPPAYVNFSMDINNNKPVIAKVGQAVQFVVEVQAFPDLDAVKLDWHKDDINHTFKAIQNNHKHYKTNVKTDTMIPQAYLQIESVELEDSGTYMLVSANMSHNTNF